MLKVRLSLNILPRSRCIMVYDNGLIFNYLRQCSKTLDSHRGSLRQAEIPPSENKAQG